MIITEADRKEAEQFLAMMNLPASAHGPLAHLLAETKRKARLEEAQWFWDNVSMRATDDGQWKAQQRIAELQGKPEQKEKA